MGGFLEWVVARRLLTLAGFGVILLGAFVPWPSLAIAAVVIVLGAALLAVQIPIALRDATDQLDGFDEPKKRWQPPAYQQYQAPELFRPEPSVQVPASPQPEPLRPADQPAPPWRPKNIPQYPER